ncbi:23S rRNA (pseudouridine(1915)-N(3))-methyltransferase [hydrothermal vent metagenome]|uniref:23S rRNA (Pseudouridine(1915)-N(3))-methyltransferase n=1 Tax=hydrothermal vent metagenome TaxID=652676 RepID=A0A3B0XX74_9ZZZZ
MHITIISIANKMPAWVETAYQGYAARLPKEYKLELLEIGRIKSSASMNSVQLKKAEGQYLLQAIPKGAHVVALDEHGKQLSTQQFSQNLEQWQLNTRHLAFLIGGADGLAEQCLQAAHQKISLSALTFPHTMVRIILAEQLYRGWTIIQGHPYHRV